MNQNFQEHLNQLGQKSRKPKSKVLDWMQEDSKARAGSRSELKTVEGGTGTPGPAQEMKLDRAANVPTRPYQKKSPVYASLHDPDMPENDPFSAVSSKELSVEPDLLTAIQTKVKIQPVTTSAATTSIATTNTVPPSHTHFPVSRTQSTPMGAAWPPVAAAHMTSSATGTGAFMRPGIGGMSSQRSKMDSRPRLPTDSLVHRNSARYYPQQRPSSGSRVRTTSDSQRSWATASQRRPGSSTQIRSGSTSSQGRALSSHNNLATRSSSIPHPHTSSRPPIPGQPFRPAQPPSHAPIPSSQPSNLSLSQPTPGQVTARFGKDYYILDV